MQQYQDGCYAGVRNDLDVVTRTFSTGCAGRGLRELRFDVVFDLSLLVHILRRSRRTTAHTFVTALPVRKKVASSIKKTLHGCTVCAMAVKNAVAMPAGVRDL
jgi:hypothetical protein